MEGLIIIKDAPRNGIRVLKNLSVVDPVLENRLVL